MYPEQKNHTGKAPNHKEAADRSKTKKMSCSTIKPKMKISAKDISEAKDIISVAIDENEYILQNMSDLSMSRLEKLNPSFNADNDKDMKKLNRYSDTLLGLALIKLGKEYLK